MELKEVVVSSGGNRACLLVGQPGWGTTSPREADRINPLGAI
jgi:hypothetical protein